MIEIAAFSDRRDSVVPINLIQPLAGGLIRCLKWRFKLAIDSIVIFSQIGSDDRNIAGQQFLF